MSCSTTISECLPLRVRNSSAVRAVSSSVMPATGSTIPDKELDVKTRCSFKDVQGGRGSMDLQVTKAEVKRFVAEVTIPKQGLCRFDMKHFNQPARMPNVVLTDRESACTVRMWEQEKGVTVAFNSCQAKCSGDAFSYLWPILVDTRSGRCA